MRSLGLVAHFDADGLVAPHVIRHVDALAAACDHVLVVSASSLSAESRAVLSARAEVLERPNTGYDFGSWQAGLNHVDRWSDLDRIILVNDSVVGPLVPYSTIISAAVESDAPWWGITESRQRSPHLQTYCIGFEAEALRHPALATFWETLEIPDDREDAIETGELGLSTALTEAGLVGRPYFTPDAEDDRVARERRARLEFLLVEARTAQVEPDPLEARRRAGIQARRLLGRPHPYNPMNALWDRALDRRLPFVKLETLRDDPYLLDPRETMLAELEAAFPDAFEGVREYLERVRPRFAADGRGRDPDLEWRVLALKATHLTGPWGPAAARDETEARGTDVDSTAPNADDYGDAYYAQYLGPPYDPAEPHWQGFFGRVAGRIVDLFHPATFLDVGCAMGILVGSMRELGVDAEGIDHSAYAIAKADPRAAGHLRVVDLLREPLDGRWDVISCIEVLEHLPSGQVDAVIGNLCRSTDTIVFSSTADEFNEGTHVNVRPPAYWAAQFADHGFYRRFDIDATFVSRDAIVFQRQSPAVHTLVSEYETALWILHRENVGTRNAVIKRDRETAALRAQAADLSAARDRLAKKLTSIEASTSFRLTRAVARRLRWLKRFRRRR